MNEEDGNVWKTSGRSGSFSICAYFLPFINTAFILDLKLDLYLCRADFFNRRQGTEVEFAFCYTQLSLLQAPTHWGTWDPSKSAAFLTQGS